ncbi:MAG: membrane-bound lytic murein transglycosylase MltF [Betaproteobacteria bacterium]|nr:membrane-bound lytic murein transglycosylase MltF [Betaproteobacteria bacterium]
MTARILLCIIACLAAGCEPARRPIMPLSEGGKLAVITINGPATWYEDAQGEPSGFEHDLVVLFAKELGVPVAYEFVASPEKAEKALSEKRGHLAAALLPKHLDLPGGLVWGPSYRSAQIQLVWRTAEPKPRSLADLAGKRVGVIGDSFADELLTSRPKLTAPLERLSPDTSSEELLGQLAEGRIDAALIDSAHFIIEHKHFPQIDVAFDVGKPVDFAWRVGTVDQKPLLDRMKVFFARIAKDGTLKRLADRYFAHAERISAIDAGTLLERINTILPKLRPHFLESELVSGFDWQLIAAIGYQESHWDSLATSPTGVRGLMMLTEDTADRLGVKNRLDQRESILGGARYLRLLADSLPPRIREPDRTFLALAAYNLGIGHLEDARILAQKKGLSPDKWQDVKQALPGLADPGAYQQLKHGFARGQEAMQFVDNVRNYQDILARVAPRDERLPPRQLPAPQGLTTGPDASR